MAYHAPLILDLVALGYVPSAFLYHHPIASCYHVPPNLPLYVLLDDLREPPPAPNPSPDEPLPYDPPLLPEFF